MSKKLIKVKLVHSTIGRDRRQEQIVKGLGLKKLNKERELEDTPAVRGMIAKVSHLVKIVGENVSAKKVSLKKVTEVKANEA